MQSRMLPDEVFYDGSQLRAGWAGEQSGLSGDVIVAFTGGCDVEPKHMLDSEDLALGHGIRAHSMLHFIVEHKGIGLDLAVARQRLLVCMAAEILTADCAVAGLERDGDDLYVAGDKLSISVAAVSPTSGLIHFAMNLDPAGAPVPAVGLTELGAPFVDVANWLLDAYVAEMESCRLAAAKVRPAR